MRTLCRAIAGLFAIAWLAALGLFAIGTFGLFGAGRDPLSVVFLVPLGLPWILWVDGTPESLRPWLAALAPLVNIAILAFVCRAARRR